jgi:D-arabinose 1-dehydrogenase-like Zn-dependent alcohol dehydrogenase
MSPTEAAQKVKTGSVAQVPAPRKPFEVVKQEVPFPTGRQVMLKVIACGVCHSDSFTVEGTWPGLKYPQAPGHEIIGTVVEVGPEATRLKKGDRVAVGWHGGNCGECVSCRSGDFVTCSKLKTPGISINGGYAEYVNFAEDVCAAVPAELDSLEAGPLVCAGVTTFNALRHSGAKPGDVVAILGLGGLGHLGVQFANKMGFKTVGIARGDDKKDFAHKLGATHYINTEKQDAAAELNKLGGAKVVLSTVTSTKAMTPLVDGLGVDGRLVIVGAGMEPLDVIPVKLLGQRRSIAGWPSGTGKDSEECMNFAVQTGIRPMIERYPFEKVSEAYERMMSGKARFRVVLELPK